MKYKVELTSIAEADAYAAFRYLRELAPKSADIWLANLFQAIFSLEEMPNRCPLISEAEELGAPIRHLLFGKDSGLYRILFDIQENSKEISQVRVLRIWHGSRDKLTLKDIEEVD